MTELNELIPKAAVLDDTSIEHPTLGQRRLVLRNRKVPLVRLNRVFFFIGDVIRNSNYTFIDSNGKIFKYVKTKTVPLIFRKITKKWGNPIGMGIIFEVDGIPIRFKTLNRQSGHEVAGLLKVNNGYILYGTYDRMYNDTRRKV